MASACDNEFDHGNPNVFPFAVICDLLGDLTLMTLPGLHGMNE
jgi:hypothetical protein